MKQKLLVATLVLISFIAGAQTFDCSKIKNENGISYIDENKTPFTGVCIEYSPNGKKLFEGEYKNGYTCGTCKWYYENGQLKEQVTYVLAKNKTPLVDGTITKWFVDGRVKEVVHFKKGNYDGEWYQLNQSGKVVKKGLYKDNKLVRGDKYVVPNL